jgi:hypothetical protein
VEATSEPVAGWIGQKATQFCMRNFLDRPSGRLQVRPSEVKTERPLLHDKFAETDVSQ